MLRSRATAALMRLKEIDRKYNIKRNEGKRSQSDISPVSSLDDTPRDLQFDSKVGSNKPDVVRAPLTTDADHASQEKASPRSKVDAQVPSSLPAKTEDLPSNDVSRLRRSPRDSPKIGAKTSVNEDDTYSEVDEETMSKSRESRSPSNLQSTSKAKDFKDSSRKSTESSMATILSQSSGVSEIVTEAIRSVKEYSSGRKSNVPDGTSVEKVLEDERDFQALDVPDERNEGIWELFHASDKSSVTDRGSSQISSREEQKAQVSRYESDTFEEASSSTGSSSSAVERSRKCSGEEACANTIRSGVKEIKITPHRRIQTVQEVVTDDRDKEIIELVAPKVMQSTSECDIGLDRELSNYVRTTEKLDDPREVLPISLLKLSKQTPPAKKHARKSKKHRKSSKENTGETQENTESPVTSDHEKLTRAKENRGEGNTCEENSSSTTIKSVEEKKKEEDCPKSKSEHTEVNNESPKRETGDGDVESIGSEKLLTEIPKKSDVTSTLRKLNRDAIDAIARRRRFQPTRETLDKPKPCRNCGTIVKLPSAESEAVEKILPDESGATSLENVRALKDHGDDRTVRGKRSKARRVSKSSKPRKVSNREKVEEKHSRLDYRQMHRLRKQAAALRLQEEREDIRNYLLELELERTRLEFGPGESIASSKLAPFKPLEFPNIALFAKSDLEDLNFKSKDKTVELQERILMLRQWLKDQYILYRDYSSLAQTVNAKYIPASLEDAKKTIRQLQKATIKMR